MFRVKEICKKQGITLKELADRMNVPPETVSRILSKDSNPTLLSLVNMAKALQVDVYELFDNFKTDLDVSGYLDVNGKIIRISGFREFEQLYKELKSKQNK